MFRLNSSITINESEAKMKNYALYVLFFLLQMIGNTYGAQLHCKVAETDSLNTIVIVFKETKDISYLNIKFRYNELVSRDLKVSSFKISNDEFNKKYTIVAKSKTNDTGALINIYFSNNPMIGILGNLVVDFKGKKSVYNTDVRCKLH
jgi:hypothetical protein